MHATIATDAAPGHVNEDFAAASTTTAVLLDGAGLSGANDGGCIHGVAWYVRQLGREILHTTGLRPGVALPDTLAHAIATVARSHEDTCDLEHPGTPSATVIIIDVSENALRYLVLADSTLVLDGPSGQTVICDNREAQLGHRHRAAMDAQDGGTPAHDRARRDYIETMLAYRNRPGGFWVAAASPEAAYHALTDEIDLPTSALLVSDGAARVVDRFGLARWEDVSRLVTTRGVNALIDANRAAERSDPRGQRWPRGKIFDDCTAILCSGWSGSV